MVFQFYLKSQKLTKKFTKNEIINYISGFYFYSNKKDNLHVYIWKIIPSVYSNHQKLFEWVICIISKRFKGRMQNSIICNLKTTFKYMAGNWYVSYLFRNRDVPNIVIKIESDVYDKKSDWYLWMLLHVTKYILGFQSLSTDSHPFLNCLCNMLCMLISKLCDIDIRFSNDTFFDVMCFFRIFCVCVTVVSHFL